MLWLLLLADLVEQPPTPRQQSAKVTVRIERASTVTEETWSRTDNYERREVHRIGEDGRAILLRLVEHQ